MFDVVVHRFSGEYLAESEIPQLPQAMRLATDLRKQYPRTAAIVVQSSAGWEIDRLHGTMPDDEAAEGIWGHMAKVERFLGRIVSEENRQRAIEWLDGSHAEVCALLGIPEVMG